MQNLRREASARVMTRAFRFNLTILCLAAGLALAQLPPVPLAGGGRFPLAGYAADLFVASDGAQSASTRNFMLPETWRHILTLPGVAEANLLQTADVSFPEGRTMLGGAELGFFRQHVGLAWVQKPRSDLIYQPDANAGLALVSESFTLRFHKRQGDRLQVPTPSGTRSLEIAGVFADYGNERGSILVERRHFARWFGNEHVRSMMLIVEQGRDVEALRQQILADHPGLTVYTNRHLRAEILRIFRQTFSITYALELIGVAVAVAGLGMTLGSVLLERRGELTTLRALGLSRSEMAASTAIEGGLVGLSGLLAGLLTSLALGWLLIEVINRQSFGWTLQFSLPWNQMAWLSLLVVGAGTLVSFAVGRWGANLPADREE